MLLQLLAMLAPGARPDTARPSRWLRVREMCVAGGAPVRRGYHWAGLRESPAATLLLWHGVSVGRVG